MGSYNEKKEGLITVAAVQSELFTLLGGAAVAVLNDSAFLRITGADAIRWLNGMVTNSTQSLQPGQGNYNFLLSAQGRIQADCTIYREISEPASFLLQTSGDQIDTVQQLLDKFIIMDDVEMTRTHEGGLSMRLLGAKAPELLQQLGLPAVEPLQFVRASVFDGDVLVFGLQSLRDTPAVELRATQQIIEGLRQKAISLGATVLSDREVDALRIVAGKPLYGVDIRDRDLPQETNQTHALHFAKGCYLGQEIVERIRSRGQVHRLFTPLWLEGEVPSLPAPLEANGKSVGEVTSTVAVGNEIFALGYLRRDSLDIEHPVTYPGGIATPRTIQLENASNSTENKHG